MREAIFDPITGLHELMDGDRFLGVFASEKDAMAYIEPTEDEPMRVNPIMPADKPRYRPRALMAINQREHVVVLDDGRRAEDLPPREAWELHQAINGGLVV